LFGVKREGTPGGLGAESIDIAVAWRERDSTRRGLEHPGLAI